MAQKKVHELDNQGQDGVSHSQAVQTAELPATALRWLRNVDTGSEKEAEVVTGLNISALATRQQPAFPVSCLSSRGRAYVLSRALKSPNSCKGKEGMDGAINEPWIRKGCNKGMR